MKNKTLIPSMAVLSLGITPIVANAEVTANFGWVSDYIYRGIFQEDSSASAGVDYAHDAGFYLGAWGADVGDGMETDLYFGYAGGDTFTYKVGFTGYYYTDDFDDTYEEINLGIGYDMFALDVAIGEWDGFGTPADYTFTSLTVAPDMWPYFKIGSFGDDFDGDYFEIGYTYSIEEHGIDLSVAVITSDDLPVTNFSDDGEIGDTTITLGIKKNLSFGE
jgi:uncharacterized protein (TIGR02001 family)